VSGNAIAVHRDERALDKWAVDRLLDWAAGKSGNKETRAALESEIHELAAGFSGPNPTQVEQLLAEIAATSWFAYRMHESPYASSVTGEGGISLAQVRARSTSH
jgi:hypothetical protein